MKVYRVTPNKRKKFTKYGVLSILSLLVIFTCAWFSIQNSKSELEIWIGSFIIDTGTISGILLIIGFLSIFTWFYFLEKNSIEKRYRCWDVYIMDNENHLYYVTLNRDAFDMKINLFTVLLRGSRRYHDAMINAWNKYCKEYLCSDEIINYLPAIIQGKITLNDYPALLALRIMNVENIQNVSNGMTFTFHADGSNRIWPAGVYNYMNDYEELVELIKSKSV